MFLLFCDLPFSILVYELHKLYVAMCASVGTCEITAETRGRLRPSESRRHVSYCTHAQRRLNLALADRLGSREPDVRMPAMSSVACSTVRGRLLLCGPWPACGLAKWRARPWRLAARASCWSVVVQATPLSKPLSITMSPPASLTCPVRASRGGGHFPRFPPF
jgi:hypothetical protein